MIKAAFGSIVKCCNIAHRLPQIAYHAALLTVDKSFVHPHRRQGLYQ